MVFPDESADDQGVFILDDDVGFNQTLGDRMLVITAGSRNNVAVGNLKI